MHCDCAYHEGNIFRKRLFIDYSNKFGYRFRIRKLIKLNDF